MKTLYFITGNGHKLEEAKHVLGESLQSIKLDLDEIQSMDSQEVIKHKLQEAIKVHPDKHLFCEDVSFNINALNGFPGPLIKWWNQKISVDLTSKLVELSGENKSASAIAMIGYWDTKQMHFFKGEVKGTITNPKGESKFGFDPIFIPENQIKTFAQMTKEEKSIISHRARALKAFKEFLDQNDN